ncbi:hypothetical protein [Nocardioides sp. YIM 152588]|uniref:hypothetical protein n=1 Tax=Nocardioides sp. YIM 152588 TaxID=3158259 RepID=UPI0032E525AB
MLLHVTRPGVVAPVAVDPTGRTGPTPRQSRGRAWRRTSANRFVPATVDPSRLEQRIVEALAVAPEGSAITGWAALAWSGARWFDGTAGGRDPLPVPVALDDDGTAIRSAGVLLCNDWLFEGEIVTVDGVPATVPERSLSFAVRRARSDREAIAQIDMAYASNLTAPGPFGLHLARLAGRPGIRRARHAYAHADENAWSPMESVMRCVWQETHQRPLCNVPIFDHDGNHQLTPDLFDPGAGVAGEYDGEVHQGLGPRRRDLGREELYRDMGIELVTMMSTDLRDTSAFSARLRSAYRRSNASGSGGGLPWTLEQPEWWVDTSTVARRLALTVAEHAAWLGRRG